MAVGSGSRFLTPVAAPGIWPHRQRCVAAPQLLLRMSRPTARALGWWGPRETMPDRVRCRQARGRGGDETEMRTRALLPTLLLPLLVLAGCASAEEELAADACDLLRDAVADGPEGLMDQDRMEQFAERSEALQERAEEEGISGEEMDEAMREECPEVFEELDTMFDPGMEPGAPEGDEGVGELEDDLEGDGADE